VPYRSRLANCVWARELDPGAAGAEYGLAPVIAEPG